MTFEQAVGQALREARGQVQMHQEAAADQLGKVQPWVSKVENGDLSIKLIDFDRLAKTYGTSVSRLWAQVEVLRKGAGL